MRRLTIAVLALVLLAIIWPHAARAETGAVLVGGKSGEREKTIAADAFRAAMRTRGLALVERSFSTKETEAVTSCLRKETAWPCVASALHDKRIQRVTVLSVDPQPGRTIKITQRLVGDGLDSTLVGQRYCEQCTDDTLARNTTELTQELIERLAVGSGRTVLLVKSTPQGARVSVDGSSVGATDLSIDIAPGHHTITIERDDYQTVTRTIEAAEGHTEDISVTLKPNDPHGSPPNIATRIDPPHTTITVRRSRVVPGAILIASTAALAAGAVLILVDQDAITARGQEVSQRYRDTAAAGLGLTIGGAVAAGVGGFLWWRYSHTTTTVSVAPTGDGAMLGLTRSF